MNEPLVTYRGIVYPWQCDHMGHMNVAWYVSKFDEATWGLLALVGLTPSYVRDRGRGMAAVQQNVGYRRELRPGDLVFVRSRILEVREKVLRFVHEMVDAETGEVAASSELTGVHLDLGSRKACALPPEVVERARALAGPAAP